MILYFWASSGFPKIGKGVEMVSGVGVVIDVEARNETKRSDTI